MHSPVPTYVVDEHYSCVVANQAMLDWLGLTSTQLIGRTTAELGVWPCSMSHYEQQQQLEHQQHLHQVRVQLEKNNTIYYWLLSAQHLEFNHQPSYMIQLMDLTEYRQHYTQLRLKAAAVEQAGEAMVLLDREGYIQHVNPAFSRITGYLTNEAVGQRLDELLHQPTERYDSHFFRRVVGQLIVTGHWEGHVWGMHKSGHQFPSLLSLSVIRNPAGQVVNHIGIFNDISQQKSYEEKLKKLALYDALTGLANRTLLMQRLNQVLDLAQRQSSSIAVFFMDLDRFKDINDQYGHAMGDALLKQVAQRLSNQVRASDLVARLAGDEFVLLLEGVSEYTAIHRADRVLAAINKPYVLKGHQLHIGLSIGIALFPAHATDADALLKYADQALYQVKQSGRNNYAVYSPP